MKAVGGLRADGIYLLPETVSELPPVAGILTAGAGNPLSHVQLLARNLGIPNVAVDSALLPELRRHDGKRIVLAVSPAGLVEIHEDGPKWDAAFGTQAEKQPEQTVMFAPDLSKLDLKQRDLVSLNKLRADDSGRTVGPKAAKLGELKSRFPDRVVAGVGIPFGLYREVVLDKPYKGSGKTVYQWMVESFRKLEALPAGSAEAAKASEALRAEIYAHRAQHRSGAAVPRAPARGDGTRVRRRFQGRRVHPQRHQRRGPARLHRRRPEPDAVQHRRLRQHRQGHHRGLGLALHRARLGLAAVAHVGARACLSGGDADAHRARRGVGRDGHAGRRQRRRRRAVGGGQRGRRRRRGRAGRGVGPHHAQQRRSAADGGGHRGAQAGAAGQPAASHASP